MADRTPSAASSKDAGSVGSAASTVAREQQIEAVAELVAAGATLLLDWAQGSVQRTRTTNCGDATCDYASCRLADAITVYTHLVRPGGDMTAARDRYDTAAQIRANWPALAEWADKHDQWHQVEEVATPEKAIRFLADAAGAEHRDWLHDLAEITEQAIQ